MKVCKYFLTLAKRISTRFDEETMDSKSVGHLLILNINSNDLSIRSESFPICFGSGNYASSICLYNERQEKQMWRSSGLSNRTVKGKIYVL